MIQVYPSHDDDGHPEVVVHAGQGFEIGMSPAEALRVADELRAFGSSHRQPAVRRAPPPYLRLAVHNGRPL